MKIHKGWERKGAIRAGTSPTIRDLEWAAGFLEGEGCFYLNTKRREFRIQAGQVNKEPLSRLQRLFGGRISFHKRTSPKWSDYWVWVVTGPRARGLAMTLYLLMSLSKKEQIKHAIVIISRKVSKEDS